MSLHAGVYLIAFLTSGFIVWLMSRSGFMDVPNHRSSHAHPTPKGGGIGIVVSFCVLAPIALVMCDRHLFELSFLLPISAIALIAALSWLDDLRPYPAIVKLGIQIFAAALVSSGVLYGIAAFSEETSFILFGVLVFGSVMTTNAVNFMDGLNGLSAGVTFLAVSFFAAAFTSAGDHVHASIALLLAVSILGFLPFNFPKARIFMGDVGSQSLGLALSWLGSELLMTSSHRFLTFSVLGALLYDVTFTLMRRALKSEPLFSAHRGHLYQLAARSRVSPTRITLLHWGFVLWGGLSCLTLTSPLALMAALLTPQITWTLFVISRAKSLDIGAW